MARAPLYHVKDMQTLPVGVIVERRVSSHPWGDFNWRAIAVLPGAADHPPGTVLRTGEGWRHILLTTETLALYPKETEAYKVNLSNDPPVVYVALRRGSGPDEPVISVPLVTVSPYEAQDILDADDQVDPVAMPPAIIALCQTFVDTHHVDQPFVKRKRRPYDPRKQGPGGRGGPLV